VQCAALLHFTQKPGKCKVLGEKLAATTHTFDGAVELSAKVRACARTDEAVQG